MLSRSFQHICKTKTKQRSNFLSWEGPQRQGSWGVCNTVFLWQSMDGLGDLAYLASNWFGRSNTKNLLHEIPRECFSTVVHGFPFPPSSKRHERNPPSVLCWLWTGVSSNRSQGGFHGCPSFYLRPHTKSKTQSSAKYFLRPQRWWNQPRLSLVLDILHSALVCASWGTAGQTLVVSDSRCACSMIQGRQSNFWGSSSMSLMLASRNDLNLKSLNFVVLLLKQTTGVFCRALDFWIVKVRFVESPARHSFTPNARPVFSLSSGT